MKVDLFPKFESRFIHVCSKHLLVKNAGPEVWPRPVKAAN